MSLNLQAESAEHFTKVTMIRQFVFWVIGLVSHWTPQFCKLCDFILSIFLSQSVLLCEVEIEMPARAQDRWDD